MAEYTNRTMPSLSVAIVKGNFTRYNSQTNPNSITAHSTESFQLVRLNQMVNPS